MPLPSLFRILPFGLPLALALSVTAASTLQSAAAAEKTFTNPIRPGADPWVVRDQTAGRWLWIAADRAENLVIRQTPTLTDPGTTREIWRAPDAGPASAQIWAPELHFLDGRWHVYFAASDGRNETHRTFILQSSTADAMTSTWTLHGPLATGEGADRRQPDIWSIDMTVLHHGGNRYAIWSGWDTPDSDRQFLYIAQMKSPLELEGPRVRLCANDTHLWERTEEKPDTRGLNEGPQVLQQGDRTFLLYSCGAAWLPTYKLGLLELKGPDPLKPASWEKQPQPVFQSTGTTFGVGHSCFVSTDPEKGSSDQTWWHIYHAKRDRSPGWPRAIFVQPFRFDAAGFPQFGNPLPWGSRLKAPLE